MVTKESQSRNEQAATQLWGWVIKRKPAWKGIMSQLGRSSGPLGFQLSTKAEGG